MDPRIYSREGLEIVLQGTKHREEQSALINEQLSLLLDSLRNRGPSVTELKSGDDTVTLQASAMMDSYETDLVGFMQTRLRELGFDNGANSIEMCFGKTKKVEVEVDVMARPRQVIDAPYMEATYRQTVYVPTAGDTYTGNVTNVEKVGIHFYRYDDHEAIGRAAASHTRTMMDAEKGTDVSEVIKTTVWDGKEVIFYEGPDYKDPRKEDEVVAYATTILAEKGLKVVPVEEDAYTETDPVHGVPGRHLRNEM